MITVYYVETNLLCIIILLLLWGQSRHKSDRFSTDTIAFHRLLWATMVLCASDMVAGICRGHVFYGARAILEISNMAFFETLAVISYLWLLYVSIKLKIPTNAEKNKNFLWALPLIAFTALAISNPLTQVLFSLDRNNLYTRNFGVYFHWLVTWSYLLISTVRTARAIAREKNRQRRREIVPLLYFIIAPTVASVVQMLFYGVSSTQVGITISIIVIFLTVQSNQVQQDTLTGLNNRRGLTNYFNSHILRHPELELTLLMLDLNNFKQVNDQFGHLTGDRALLDVADALKEVCAEMPGRLFLCRYGGDEFLIAGTGRAPDEVQRLKSLIQEALERKNRESGYPYVLRVGVGAAVGKCADLEAVERLLGLADEAMYADKKRMKGLDNPGGIPVAETAGETRPARNRIRRRY